MNSKIVRCPNAEKCLDKWGTEAKSAESYRKCNHINWHHVCNYGTCGKDICFINPFNKTMEECICHHYEEPTLQFTDKDFKI